MPLDYRSDDAIFTICQNNAAKSIEISGVNTAACELLDYSAPELVGQPLRRILSPRIGDLLQEYVEFEEDANDVGMVLSKVQSFSVIGKNGKEHAFRMKLVRADSGGGRHFFSLVLQDKTGLRKNEALMNVISKNFKGHESLDAQSGLPDRLSLIKDIEVMGRYINKSGVHSCFSVFQLDNYSELRAQYGDEMIGKFLAHIAFVARQSLRPDDVVGCLGDKCLGVLLVDMLPNSSRMVFNRLRWQVAANPYVAADKSSIGLTASIAFCNVDGHIDEKRMIELCEDALEKSSATITNTLVEVAV